MMKIGNKTFRDRRGAAQRILGQIRANGCLPRYANFKTVRKLKEAGAISFCDGRYWLGQAPSLHREPGYYWVKGSDWLVAEWSGTAWYEINGQRPIATEEYEAIGERIERRVA